MTTIIKKSEYSLTGYKMEVYDDNHALVSEHEIDEANGNGSIKLPANPSGRTWVAEKKLTDLPYEVPVKLPITHSTDSKVSHKKWEEYMTEEEAQIVAEIMARCKERKAEAEKKPKLTEREKLEQKIAKLRAALELMEAEG